MDELKFISKKKEEEEKKIADMGGKKCMVKNCKFGEEFNDSVSSVSSPNADETIYLMIY